MQETRQIYWMFADPPDGTHQPVWINRPAKPKDDPNWDHLLPRGPRPDLGNEADGMGSGFPVGMPRPMLEFSQALDHSKLADILLMGHPAWILSDRAKMVFERTDPDAFEFCEAQSIFANDQQGPRFWLCEMVRFIDAVDEVRSDVKVQMITRNGRRVKRVSLGPSKQCVFRADAIGDAHAFRAFHAPSTKLCDETFVAALAEAELTGVTPLVQGVLDT